MFISHSSLGNAKQHNIKQTIKLQKRAIRYINKSSYNSHTSPLFRNSKILKLKDLYEFHVINFMFKYDRGLLPTSLSTICQHQYNVNTSHNTRNINLITKPIATSEFVNVLPKFKFPEIWNKWANILAAMHSVSKLKNTLKNHYFDLYG